MNFGRFLQGIAKINCNFSFNDMSNDNLPKRKTIRWDKQDYSHPGEYMITVCTKDMKQILSKIVVNTERAHHDTPLRSSNSRGCYQTVGAIHESPVVQLTPAGKIVDDVINNLPDRLGVVIEKYVIMPNHIHLLIKIPYPENWQGDSVATKGRSTVSKTIGYIKMNSSKAIREKFGITDLWQRSFHDHVIRDENDRIGALNYINNNPARWISGEDTQ